VIHSGLAARREGRRHPSSVANAQTNETKRPRVLTFVALAVAAGDWMGAVLAARDVAAERRRAAALDRRHHSNGPFAANRARASLSALFSWAIGEGLLDSNPVVGTNKAIDETPRDRVLTDDELSLIWRHAGDLNYVRLLILTGQRGEEVGGLRRSELRFADRIWSISAERTKTGKPHDVPLSTLALEILHAQFKREGRDLVFGAREGAFR
jgi:integrase